MSFSYSTGTITNAAGSYEMVFSVPFIGTNLKGQKNRHEIKRFFKKSRRYNSTNSPDVTPLKFFFPWTSEM